MKTKAQRKFIQDRKAYEKILKEKAKNNTLSLSEKIEWQQLSRNKYRERLFSVERLRSLGVLTPRGIFFTLIIGGFIIRSLAGALFYAFSDDENFSEPYNYEALSTMGDMTYADGMSSSEPYDIIISLSDAGNNLYHTYSQAQSDYEKTNSFDINALYVIDEFNYEAYSEVDEQLYSKLVQLHKDILALAKLEYSGIALSEQESKIMKTAIESSKNSFDAQVQLALDSSSEHPR